MDADGKNVRQLTNAPGCYNGGPFFSPDGKQVIFRSDRKKKDHLQLYVINADGTRRAGLDRRPELGLLGAVLVQGRQAHRLHRRRPQQPDGAAQLRLYWMNIETGKKVRLTFAPGADVLPVFSPDGTKLMWTSTRDGSSPSQIYIADFTPPK